MDGWIDREDHFIHNKIKYDSPFKKQLKACEKVCISFTQSHTFRLSLPLNPKPLTLLFCLHSFEVNQHDMNLTYIIHYNP